MANLLLATAILGLLLVWRRRSWRLPMRVRSALISPSRMATLAGIAVILISLGYSMGDVLAGRTQVSKSPVQYATRLKGPEAHHHDLVDAGRFWRQVLLQAGAGLSLGTTIIALSRLGKRTQPQRA